MALSVQEKKLDAEMREVALQIEVLKSQWRGLRAARELITRQRIEDYNAGRPERFTIE